MKKTIVIASVLVLALGATFYLVGAHDLFACSGDKAASTKSACQKGGAGVNTASTCSGAAASASADAACEKVCAAAAARITAGKKQCCKDAVQAVMASWAKVRTAGAPVSCSKSAASASCSAGRTAEADCPYGAAISAVLAGRGACCRETVMAFKDAVCNAKGAAAACTASAGQSASCSKHALTQTAGTGDASAKEAASEKAGSLDAMYAPIRFHEGRRLVMTGHALCGKCDLHAAESCQPVFQTKDGSLYPLVYNNHVKAMRHAESENGFEIVSYVRKLEGRKYLDVKKFKSL